MNKRNIMKKIMLSMKAFTLLAVFAFSAGSAYAVVSVEDDAYLYYGEWVHATNAGGGHETSARPVLWRKARNAAGLFYSFYLVEARAWNAGGQVPAGGWQESDMFLWLNGFDAAAGSSFYDGAFTASEKNGLSAAPDGDIGSRVTLPDMYRGYAQPSRFGTAQYRGSGNLEYWLRRPYESTVSANDAWGVGVAGNEGPGVVNRTLGTRPLIALNLSSFLFRTGNGTQATPYRLYAPDDRMRPTGIVVNGAAMRLNFSVPVAAFGSLPAPADFTVVRSAARAQRNTPVVSVSIPGDDPNALQLTLSQAAAYRDGFIVSYTLPGGADGTLSGGALVAADGERIALASFNALTATNETPATVDDLVVLPSAEWTASAWRGFDALLTVAAARPSSTVRLDSVTRVTGWDPALEVTWNATPASVRIHGTPTVVGRHTLQLGATVDGTALSGATVVVDVLPQNSLGSLVVTPDTADPIELRREADVTYTVGSSVVGAVVEVLTMTGDSSWNRSGLDFTPDIAGRTFRVTGIPTQVGRYPVYLTGRIDGTDAQLQYDVEVVYPNTEPGPGDLLVTSDLVGPILAGRAVQFTYTVGSSIQNAEVVLQNAFAGEDWANSGLNLQVNAAARQIAVWGIPAAAGSYSINISATIDGAAVGLHTERFTVGNLPGAGDLTFTPDLPRGTAYRPYRATTTVSSPVPDETVVLNGVTAGNEWIGSGLSFAHDIGTRAVTVEGTPTAAGTYNLRVDVTIGGTRIADVPLPVRIDPVDGTPGAGNVVVVPSTSDPFVVNRPADVSYTVRSGIEDAVVVLRNVVAGTGWNAGGLNLVWSGSGNTFAVYGTPRAAGTCTLLLDVVIDGTTISGYELRISVAGAPPTDADLLFSPALPHARVYRPYSAATVVESRTGAAVSLLEVSPGAGWQGSGLTYSYDGSSNGIAVSGTPTNSGTYALLLELTLGGVRLSGVSLEITVEAAGTAPTPGDIAVEADVSGPLVVGVSTERIYTVTTGIADANVEVTALRGGTGWNASGLRFAYVPLYRLPRGTTGAVFTVYGTPQTAGTFPLLLDVEIDGELVPGCRVNIGVIESPAGAADITFTPAVPAAKAGRPFLAATTVGSRTGADVVLHAATGSINWELSGLSCSLSGNTITIDGTPVRAGDYGLNLDVTIGNVRISNGTLAIRVDPADTPPSPAWLMVVPEATKPITVDSPANALYRVTSGISDASVALRSVAPGSLWEFSGLQFGYGAGDASFRVYGTPTRVGTFTLLLDVLLDGVLIEDYPAGVTVYPADDGQPPVVVDAVFTPPLPNAKAGRLYSASTTASSRSGQSTALHDVAAESGWAASGLGYDFSTTTNEISVSGTPALEGVYSLIADLTVGKTRLDEEPLLLVVDTAGTKPTADNVAIVPDRVSTILLNVRTEIVYRIATGIGDANVSLRRVRAVSDWAVSGLAYRYDLAAKTFTIYGTPVKAGTYTLLLDIEIDGVSINDYAARIVVVEGGASPDNGGGGGGGGCNSGVFSLAALAMLVAVRFGRR